ncbi:EF-hand domain-containing protein [Streptomyces sp. NPDC087440]|uniref:EF-hand domain-containing protein n=1 Tax=Streptomyces sp. NPDC087440 TaxID=3365790 RepID=UPI0038198917
MTVSADVDFLTYKIDRTFDMLDGDADGLLTEADLCGLADGMAKALGEASDAPKIVELRDAFRHFWHSELGRMSSDSSREVLTREDFCAGMRGRATSQGPEARDEFLGNVGVMTHCWMDIGSRDGDGRVTRDEFVAMYHNGMGVPEGELGDAFAELDVDGDGLLDRDEVRQATAEYYTSEDPEAPGNWLFGPI